MKTSLVLSLVGVAVLAAGATAVVLMHRHSDPSMEVVPNTDAARGDASRGDAAHGNATHHATTHLEYVTLSSGKTGSVRLLSRLSSETSQTGDPVRAELSSPWSVDGRMVLPAGTRVEGQVTLAESKGRMKHNAKLALSFNSFVLADGQRLDLSSRPIEVDAGGETQRDIITVGAGTAAGAVIGAITGNTTRGAAMGAAGGGAAALLHQGDPVELPAGTVLRLTLLGDVRVAVKGIRS